MCQLYHFINGRDEALGVLSSDGGEMELTTTSTLDETGGFLHQLACLMKEDYILNGWSEIPEIMPAEDFVVTGSFEVNGIEVVVTNCLVDVYTLQGIMLKQ